MFTIGELVKWRSALDADYSYGTLLELRRTYATVLGSGYYTGVTMEVHIKYIEKAQRGGKGFGGSEEHCKRSVT